MKFYFVATPPGGPELAMELSAYHVSLIRDALRSKCASARDAGFEGVALDMQMALNRIDDTVIAGAKAAAPVVSHKVVNE